MVMLDGKYMWHFYERSYNFWFCWKVVWFNGLFVSDVQKIMKLLDTLADAKYFEGIQEFSRIFTSLHF